MKLSPDTLPKISHSADHEHIFASHVPKQWVCIDTDARHSVGLLHASDNSYHHANINNNCIVWEPPDSS